MTDARIRVATYNLQNLFLRSDGALDRSPASGKALVRMLELLNADLLAVQEVGGQAALEALNRELADPYPSAACVPGNSNRNIHLGYLCRWPLTLTSHRDLELRSADGALLKDFAAADAPQVQPLRFQRDVLRAELKLPGGRSLTLLNAHLKSRATADWRLLSSDTIRGAEIRALAAIAETAARSGPTLLLGDLNETFSSDLMRPLRALNWIDAMQLEVSVSRGARARCPGTYWKKRHTRLDYLLLSPDLAATQIAGTATTHAGALGQRASDHYPVSVDLDIDLDIDLGVDPSVSPLAPTKVNG